MYLSLYIYIYVYMYIVAEAPQNVNKCGNVCALEANFGVRKYQHPGSRNSLGQGVTVSYEQIARTKALLAWLQNMIAYSAGHKFTVSYNTSRWFNKQ